MSDADVVLRQLVVSVGGITGGAALLYAYFTLRWKVPGAWTIARMLVAMSILALLTTEHIYSHLLAGTSPAWQLWSALIGFTLGAESLGRRIRQGKATVVEPEPGRIKPERGRIEDAPEVLRRAAEDPTLASGSEPVE